MGHVYRVFDRAAGEERALKRMSESSEREGVAVQAFEREYGVLTSLSHPRIIRVYDYGVDAEGRYYTMELVPGQDMRDLAPLSYRRACSYARDVATSLSLLHARRLLHRDLSPGNVRALDDAHCKLLDFGALAAFGRNATIMGTPPFIPPEALQRAALNQTVDLFALGALIYWMLTRRHAFPAMEIAELPFHWRTPPAPPSRFAPDVPAELDELVLALLRVDPLARPASAAEVMARLSVIGDLPPEDASETELLAQSFLEHPPFTGRASELALLSERTSAAIAGRGGSVRVVAPGGMGRTRLLDELAVAAQLAGALVLRADARTQVSAHGVSRALSLSLLEKLPDARSQIDGRIWRALANLGPDVQQRLTALAPRPPDAPASAPRAPISRAAGGAPASVEPSRGVPSKPTSSSRRGAPSSRDPASSGAFSSSPGITPGSLEAWFAAVSRNSPIVALVEDVDAADDASLGFLNALAKLAEGTSLLLVVSERVSAEPRRALGLERLRERATPLELRPLSAAGTLELTRSLFCDPPNVERFADWLHQRSAGSPLHAIELCRQLTAQRVITYSAGLWTLPMTQADVQLPRSLGEALRWRLGLLDEGARRLAEILCLTRNQPTSELCRALSPALPEAVVQAELDALVRHDVLRREAGGYRFSSGAIRDALLEHMHDESARAHHALLGEVLAERADDPVSCIDAGFHLIEGGAEQRGAELIARVTHDTLVPRGLAANLYAIGRPLEAALLAYGRHRRSLYERLPLLAALSVTGYYEERVWADRYGDQALDVLEQASGLALARHLRRWLGGWLSLIVGVLFAYARFRCVPASERHYSFKDIFIHLFASVTALTGTATLCLDRVRAARVAEVLEPFAVLPERLTPRGVYEYCHALREIGGENSAEAFAMFDTAARRFGDPRYYPTLPPESRRLMFAAAHFARAIFGMFQARGTAALDSALVLDELNYVLYSAIASQIRFLHFTLRAQFQLAAPHREQVELHAARTGSGWQFETWETVVVAVVYSVLISDTVGATHVVHRLAVLSKRLPALRRYREITTHALTLVNGDAQYASRVAAEYEAVAPRSFLGWAIVMGLLARGFNQAGDHARARAICERVHAQMTEADREFIGLFLVSEIELALALAHLGQVGQARQRLREELARLSDCDQPLMLGLLWEARARVAWIAGDQQEFAECLLMVERWFRPSGAPSLIAKCEQLRQLLAEGQPGPANPKGQAPEQTTGVVRGEGDEFGARDTLFTSR